MRMYEHGKSAIKIILYMDDILKLYYFDNITDILKYGDHKYTLMEGPTDSLCDFLNVEFPSDKLIKFAQLLASEYWEIFSKASVFSLLKFLIDNQSENTARKMIEEKKFKVEYLVYYLGDLISGSIITTTPKDDVLIAKKIMKMLKHKK